MKKIISIFMAIVLVISLMTSSLALEPNMASTDVDTAFTQANSASVPIAPSDDEEYGSTVVPNLNANSGILEDGIVSTFPDDQLDIQGNGFDEEELVTLEKEDVNIFDVLNGGEDTEDQLQEELPVSELFEEVIQSEEIAPAAIARASANLSLSTGETGLFIPVEGGNGSSSSTAWQYVGASNNGTHVYRNDKTFAAECVYNLTAYATLFGRIINVKPGSYSLSMSEAKYTGDAGVNYQRFDATRSSPKSWTCTALRGNATTSYSELNYTSGMTPAKWYYLDIHNIKLGDVIEVSAYEGTYYLVCGPRLSGTVDIYKDGANVSGQVLQVRLPQSGNATVNLSARTSIDGTWYSQGDSEVTWSSSNTNIATVSSSGAVTFKKAGSVQITATWNDKYFRCSNTVTVTVSENKPPVITDVEPNPSTRITVVTATDDRDTNVLKYGYSNSKTEYPETWQDSSEFMGLLGTKYFYAKDTEGGISEPFMKFVYGYADAMDSELVGLTTEYLVGDKIDLDGVILVLKFSNGDTIDIPVTEDMLSDYDNMTPGPENITVTYGDIVKPATVNFSGWRFSVLFPDEIAIRIDEDGTPIVDGNYFIKNNSTRAIKVTGIQVNGRAGWEIISGGLGYNQARDEHGNLIFNSGDNQIYARELDSGRLEIFRSNGTSAYTYTTSVAELQKFNNMSVYGRMRNGKLVFETTSQDGAETKELYPKLSSNGIDIWFSTSQGGALEFEPTTTSDTTGSISGKKLMLTINGTPTDKNGSIAVSDDSWTIGTGETLPLVVTAVVPAQDDLEPGVFYKVATVEWTAGWVRDSSSETPVSSPVEQG